MGCHSCDPTNSFRALNEYSGCHCCSLQGGRVINLGYSYLLFILTDLGAVVVLSAIWPIALHRPSIYNIFTVFQKECYPFIFELLCDASVNLLKFGMRHFEEACCKYFESCTPRLKTVTVTTLTCEFQKSYFSSTTMSEMSKQLLRLFPEPSLARW